MNITDRLKNKRILIWGYGREGKSTERFLKEYCEVVYLPRTEGVSSSDLRAAERRIRLKLIGEK